jgi:hypothetical protein
MEPRLTPMLCIAILAAAALVVALAGRHFHAVVDASAAVAQPRLGAHALLGQEDQRAQAVARVSLSTSASGSSLLAFVAGYAANDASPRDSYHNQWRMNGPPMVYRGYQGRFNVRAYVSEESRGGVAHRVDVAKAAVPEGELTLAVVEVRGAGRLVDSARVYPEPALRIASGSVSTDGPALLVAAWWGDGSGLRHVVIPGDGFRVIERFTSLPPNSAVQGVIAVRQVDRSGSYRVTWNAVPRQGAVLWLFAFAAPVLQRPAGNQHSGAARPDSVNRP